MPPLDELTCHPACSCRQPPPRWWSRKYLPAADQESSLARKRTDRSVLSALANESCSLWTRRHVLGEEATMLPGSHRRGLKTTATSLAHSGDLLLVLRSRLADTQKDVSLQPI